MSKILVIVGTTREGRIGRKIADWYLEEAKKNAPEGMEFELFDVGEEDVPMLNVSTPPMMGQYSEYQQTLADTIAAADGYVIVTGEYNHAIPGSLKNFLDYAYAEWNNKACAYVGYGSIGAARAIEQLILVMTALQVASVSNAMQSVSVSGIGDVFDENDMVKADHVHGDIKTQLEALNWWTNALKEARV